MCEIERSLKEEIREKKKIGNSVHSKKGKRGYIRGGVKTPADLMTAKERRAYTRPSEVTTSNIYYDQIMKLEDFKALSRQKKMLVLDAYKQKYKVSEIADTWQLSKGSVYHYFKAYLKNAPADEEQTESTVQSAVTEALEKEADTVPSQKCSFMLMGDFEAESLSKKLSGLAIMLDDKRKYEIRLELKELQN